MEYLWAFAVGGGICVIGQLLISLTRLTPARILVIFVTTGVVLTALGVYEPLVDLAGAGATVPLTGFGYALGTRRHGGGHGKRLAGRLYRRHFRHRRRGGRGHPVRLPQRPAVQPENQEVRLLLGKTLGPGKIFAGP